MIGLLMLASTTPAYVNGNQLLSLCEASAPACIAYVQGVSDATDIFQNLELMPRHYCAPDATTAKQLRDVVVKALRDAPESRTDGAAGLAWSALIRAFPCDAPKGKPKAKDSAAAKQKPKTAAKTPPKRKHR